MAENQSSKTSIKDSEVVRATVEDLKKAGRKVQVLGRVVNGKIELEQEHLAELQRKYPNAEMAFVAVNAPFDPVSRKMAG